MLCRLYTFDSSRRSNSFTQKMLPSKQTIECPQPFIEDNDSVVMVLKCACS